MQTILSGHTTADTAYVVDDYPYGFRLRCKIRYWLEYKPGKGFRLVSQTSNPKRPGLVWNKPKASTYSRFAGCMGLDDKGHVTWTGLSEYDDVHVCVAWRDKYVTTMPKEAREFLHYWITRKLDYEQAKLEGRVKVTMTCTDYGCVTDPGFGTPVAPPTVETTVCKSDYTPEQLVEMGRTLRQPVGKQIAVLKEREAGV